MGWQYTPYAILSLVTAAVAAGLSIYASRRLGTPGARMGALFMAGVCLWGVAYAIDLSATDLAGKVLWSKVSYLGIVVVPPAWFGFAAEYTGRERWINRRNLALLSVIPVFVVALIFTNELHHLIYSKTALDSSGPYVYLKVSHGAGFWVWLAYAYTLLLIGSLLVLSMLVRSGALYTKQGAALLFGVSAPWLGNVMYVSGLNPEPDLDLTLFCLLLTGIAMMLAISRFGLLDLVPVARTAVVEEMADGVIVLDDQSRVVDINPAARPLSKLPASKAIGQPADMVLSSETVLRQLDCGEEDGVADELRIRTGTGDSDGEIQRDYEVTVTPLWKAGSRQRVRLILARDVTERAEKDLLFRLLTDNSSDIVSIYDRSGEFIYASPSAERVLGYGPDEAMKLGNDPEIIHPEDRKWVWERREEIWAHPGVSGPLVFRVRHREGSWRHVEGAFNNLLEHPGVGAVVASWRDVTKRVEAEEEVWRLNATLERRVDERTVELEESEAKYREIFENAVEGIFQISADGRLLTANPAMARIFGYDSSESLISSVTDLRSRLYEDPRQRKEIAALVRREGAVSGYELRMIRRDGGAVWVSASVRALHDEAGKTSGYEGTLQDITERVESRRTLERRVAALSGIAATLTVDQSLKATLDSLASGVVQTTEALACSVYLIDSNSKALLMSGSHGLSEGYTDGVRASWREDTQHPALRSFLSQSPVLVRGGRRLFLDDQDFAPIHHFIREAPWDNIRVTPLVARGEALGAISAYYPPGSEPTRDESTFLEAVADQAAVAVENARLFSAAQGAAALKERQRLSRELHDSVSQALYGIVLGSRTARTLLDRDTGLVAEPLEYVLSLAQAGLAEMRALIFELRPEALESEGLISALEKQASALHARHEISVHADLGEEPDIPPGTKEALYRVAQEAMQNAAKHSGAMNLELSLELTSGGILLRIDDDGAGFDPSGYFPGHLGLKSMRERTEHLGGTLEIESAPGQGTRVRARIPL